MYVLCQLTWVPVVHKLLNTSCWHSHGRRGCIPADIGTRGKQGWKDPAGLGRPLPTGAPWAGQPRPRLQQDSKGRGAVGVSHSLPKPLLSTAPTSPTFSGIPYHLAPTFAVSSPSPLVTCILLLLPSRYTFRSSFCCKTAPKTAYPTSTLIFF